jgi:hypothetical protein
MRGCIENSSLIEATPAVCYWTILSSFIAVAIHFLVLGFVGGFSPTSPTDVTFVMLIRLGQFSPNKLVLWSGIRS